MDKNNIDKYDIENLHTCNNKYIHSYILGKPIIFSNYFYHICKYNNNIIYKHITNKNFYTYADILSFYILTVYMFLLNEKLFFDLEETIKNSNDDDKNIIIDNKKYDFITINNKKHIIIDSNDLIKNIKDIKYIIDAHDALNEELNYFTYDKTNLILSFGTST